jgi:hypothetical protein
MSDRPRASLFPLAEEERLANNRHSEHLLFLLGENTELRVPRFGLFSSLKRMIARPSVPTSAAFLSCAISSHTPQSASPIPIPLEKSPLFKAPTLATTALPCDEVHQPDASEFSDNMANQGLHLQFHMALVTTCTTNRTVIASASLTPSHRTFDSSMSVVTPMMKDLFVGEAVSEVTTEANSNSFLLTRLLSPLERATAEARAAGYHLHKPVSLALPPPSSPTPPGTYSVDGQRVLHGDGLRRLVILKNASAYPTSDLSAKETKKSSSSSSLSAPHTNVHDIDYELCLKRVGRGVGDDWVHRARVMPSLVNLDVRLWDPKRKEDDKIEVQLGRALLRSSPLKRVLRNSIPKDSVELEQSCPIPRRLRNVCSNVHRHRVVMDSNSDAKFSDESTPSLVCSSTSIPLNAT